MLYTTNHVANISAQKEKKKQSPRIFSQIQNQKRTKDTFKEKKKRTSQNFSLAAALRACHATQEKSS